MKRKASIILCSAVLLFLLAGCAVQVGTPSEKGPAATPAPGGGEINVPGLSIQLYVPGPNPLLNTPDAHGRPAGFWLGLWHGVISIVTLLASFVTKANVQMYEVHNDGPLYNLGFFLGILIFPAIWGLFFGWRR